jgi:hypothetical protein
MAYRFRPSAAPIWGECSGAVAELNNELNVESAASRDGTAAHWVGSELLKIFKAFGDRPPARSFIGNTCPENGVIIDEKMAEGAETYALEVIDYVQRFPGGELLIEHPVHAPQIHEQCGGTLDCAYRLPGRLVLFDYKHGFGAVAARSLQLVCYVAGLINYYQIDGQQDQQIEADLRIVQPFCYHNDGVTQQWSGMLSDLRGDINKLHHAAHFADQRPVLSSGSHCRYCPALWRCKAARTGLANMFTHVESPPDMDRMDGESLAVERAALEAALKLGKARLEAVEDVLTERVKRGDADVPLSLSSVPGRLKWTADYDDVMGLGVMCGVDLRKKELITPTQAVALIKDEDVIASMSARPHSLKLVDKSNSLGAKAFKPKGN